MTILENSKEKFEIWKWSNDDSWQWVKSNDSGRYLSQWGRQLTSGQWESADEQQVQNNRLSMTVEVTAFCSTMRLVDNFDRWLVTSDVMQWNASNPPIRSATPTTPLAPMIGYQVKQSQCQPLNSICASRGRLEWSRVASSKVNSVEDIIAPPPPPNNTIMRKYETSSVKQSGEYQELMPFSSDYRYHRHYQCQSGTAKLSRTEAEVSPKHSRKH